MEVVVLLVDTNLDVEHLRYINYTKRIKFKTLKRPHRKWNREQEPSSDSNFFHLFLSSAVQGCLILTVGGTVFYENLQHKNEKTI